MFFVHLLKSHFFNQYCTSCFLPSTNKIILHTLPNINPFYAISNNNENASIFLHDKNIPFWTLKKKTFLSTC